MEKRTKKLPAIVLEDGGMVMEEVTKELKPLLSTKMSTEEHRALNTFFGTLAALILDIFDYLPSEQQEEILANCGTWFDIGVLLGKSPKLLVEILDRVNPKVGNIEIPDWLADKLGAG
jgi:hypothetical protein